MVEGQKTVLASSSYASPVFLFVADVCLFSIGQADGKRGRDCAADFGMSLGAGLGGSLVWESVKMGLWGGAGRIRTGGAVCGGRGWDTAEEELRDVGVEWGCAVRGLIIGRGRRGMLLDLCKVHCRSAER